MAAFDWVRTLFGSSVTPAPEFKFGTLPLLPEYEQDRPIKTGANFAAAARDGYGRNELIYACIQKRANALGSVDLDVENAAGDEQPNSPLAALLDRPNPLWGQSDFIQSISIFQDLAGVAYYEKVRSKAGRVVELWPLRPDWVKPILNNQGLAGYEYTVAGMQPIRLEAKDVLALRRFDPLNLYRGTSPVGVLARSGDTDNAMTDFMRNFFELGAVPQGILTTEQLLQDPDVAKIRHNWGQRYGGWKNWFEPAVFDKRVTYQRISSSFDEMGFESLDSRNEARICMVLAVPPILIGANVGLERATYSNYETARKAWWEDDLHPALVHLGGQLSRDLLPEFGGNLRLVWDLSEVPALRDDQDAVWARGKEALATGAILVDEYREMIGLDPLPNNSGRIFLRPFNLIEVPADGGPQPATSVTPAATPAAKPTTAPPAVDDGATKALTAPTATKAAGNKPNDEALRLQHERQMQRAVGDYLTAQQKRVTAAIRSADAKALERKGAEAVTQLSFDDVFWQNEIDILYSICFKEIAAAATDGVQNAGDDLLAQVGVGIDYDLVNADVTKQIKAYTFDLVKDITDTTRTELQTKIAAWQESGQPLDDLIEALTPTFGEARAKLISSTEVTRAFATGNQAAWTASGVVDGMEWSTANDELVCPVCAPLNGTKLDLDAEDIPPAHPACRCWLRPSVNLPGD